MKRTTVFLPDHLHDQLRREAFERRVSMAALIRSRLEEGKSRRPPKSSSHDPLAAAEGIVSNGSLTRDIDAELYGI